MYPFEWESDTLAIFLLHLEFHLHNRKPEEQHIQLIRNEEKVKTDSDWSENFGMW